MSIKSINQAIAHQGIELVKGSGYFYFAQLPGFPDETPVPASVYVSAFSHMTEAEWLEAAGCNGKEAQSISTLQRTIKARRDHLEGCTKGFGHRSRTVEILRSGIDELDLVLQAIENMTGEK